MAEAAAGGPILHTRTFVRSTLSEKGIRPSKALGQNFVIDANIIRKIVRLAGVGPEDHVLEIGAGLGSLTVALSAAARRVVAVELDRRLVEVLRDTTAQYSNVEVAHGDALRIDLGALLASHPRWRLVANLPYNIAVPVILRVLNDLGQIEDLTVMAQRELGERICAAPGGASYGAPTVVVHYWAQCQIIASIARGAFWPPPGVDSVLLKIRRRPEPAVDVDKQLLFRVVKAGFAQRRKRVSNAIASSFDLPRSVIDDLLEREGIDLSARAQVLSVAQFGRIAKGIGELV